MSEARSGRKELYTLSAAYFFSYMGVGAIQPYLKPYLEDLNGWSGPKSAWVLGSVYLSGIFAQFVSVTMVRMFGPRLTVIIGLGFCTAFSWLIVLHPTSFPLLLAFGVIWGWGASCLWVGGPSIVLDNADEKTYGSASSVLHASVFFSQGLGVLVLGWIASEYGRPKLFIVAAVISIIANVISFGLPRARAKVERVSLLEGMKVLCSWQGLIVSILMLSSSFGFGILLGNLSSSVAEARQDFGSVGTLTLGFYIARLVLGWAAGPLSDRFGRAPLLVFGYGSAAVGLFLAGFSDHPAVVTFAALSLGIQIGAATVTVTALIGDWAPPAKRHVILGTLQMWKGVGAASTIILGQYLKIWMGGYETTFFIFSGLMAICVVLALVLGALFKQEE